MAVQREYLSPNEVAELLGVSPFTIRRYIKLGELKAVKLLGGFRVHREDLQRFLKAHEVNSTDEDLSPVEATAEAAPPEPEILRVPERREGAKPRRPSNSKPLVPRAVPRRTTQRRIEHKKTRRSKG